AAKKGSRSVKRVVRKRPELEHLEHRLAPAGLTLTGEPQPLPIGNVKAGQTIQLKVEFSTADLEDPTEGEPVVIQSSYGTTRTISAYGSTQVKFPITVDGELLTAFIRGYDRDEDATIEVVRPEARIAINNTADDKSDNITLFNPAPLTQRWQQR